MRGLTYDFEGPDAESVSREMEDALVKEYKVFERSIEQEKGRGLSRGGGEQGNRDVEYLVRQRVLVQDHAIEEHQLPIGPTVKAGWKAVEYGGLLHSLLTGNYIDLVAAVLLGFSFKKKGGFTALVGGKRIRATTRHGLRKEVQRVQNQMLHEIMSAIRLHNKSREIAVNISTRLTMKKEHAKAHWEARVSGSRAHGEDWRGRVMTLRHGIEVKQMGAQEQWVGL